PEPHPSSSMPAWGVYTRGLATLPQRTAPESSHGANEDLRLVGNGEVDGTGDEAPFVRVLVKRACLLEVGTGYDPHLGAQRHLAKSDAAVDRGVCYRWAIFVRGVHALGLRGNGQG